MSLSGKSAVVTGATRGIGKAIALALANAGANVVISGRSEGTLEAVCEEIRASGVNAAYVAGDVQNYEDAENLVNECIDQFGSLDILVNNAGITKDNLLIRMKEDEWDDVINVNLKGSYNTIRAAAKRLMKQRSGRIINISSVVGVMGNAGQVNYAASKAGVIGMTKSVAKELASRNVTCNAIAPGYIQTDMTDGLPEDKKEALLSVIPMGRLGEAKAIADAVLFLAGEGAEYITGQVLNVDGGMVI